MVAVILSVFRCLPVYWPELFIAFCFAFYCILQSETQNIFSHILQHNCMAICSIQGVKISSYCFLKSNFYFREYPFVSDLNQFCPFVGPIFGTQVTRKTSASLLCMFDL